MTQQPWRGRRLQQNTKTRKVQNREEFYRTTHIQTIRFEIARQATWPLTEGHGARKAKLKYRARHQLFPQVLRAMKSLAKINPGGKSLPLSPAKFRRRYDGGEFK